MNVTYCGPDNLNYLTCYKDYVANHGDYNSVENCTCSMGCREAYFRTEISSSEWPGESKEPFYTTTCNKHYPKTSINCFTAYRFVPFTMEV
ncbi:hypothetical protein L596_003934 [Steinernema carpocapsae]|nr:hypothetical protein L596_003934 [Steinernema carpocapsae]